VLHETTFEDFRVASQEHGLEPTKASDVQEHHPRETYRAPYKRKGFPQELLLKELPGQSA
jgi:hypothetical protein